MLIGNCFNFFYAENPFFRFLINVKLLELQPEWRVRWINEVIHSLSTLLQIVVMLYISDLNTQKFWSDISVFRARTVQPKRVQHQLSSQSLSPRRRKKLKKKVDSASFNSAKCYFVCKRAGIVFFCIICFSSTLGQDQLFL